MAPLTLNPNLFRPRREPATAETDEETPFVESEAQPKRLPRSVAANPLIEIPAEPGDEPEREASPVVAKSSSVTGTRTPTKITVSARPGARREIPYAGRKPSGQGRIAKAGYVDQELFLEGEGSEPVRAGPPPRIRVPVDAASDPGQIELTPAAEGRLSLVVRDAPLNEVLSILASQQGVNVVAGEDVTARISVTLQDVTLEDALNAITTVAGYTWTLRNNIILVTTLDAEGKSTADAQGLMVQVFNLNYVAGADVEAVAKGLISPAGKLFTTITKKDDVRRTREVLVVEDSPHYVAKVASYLAQVDHPPRQVLIEGYVLQVNLKDDTRHGVNWNAMAKAFGANLTLGTLGFAVEGATPGSFLKIDGTDVDAFVEALKNTTDAKTLARPKLMALNGQEARIQIGSRFGYLVTTTTQTSTLQNVNFLDVGVLLTVTPHISQDNNVLLTVKPEVSDGQINPVTQLPEQNTTEVETEVMLPDGGGIVIGGLIKETDSDKQSKVPILGDLWAVGRLFQRRNVTRERVEIVIALVPRVIPYDEAYAASDAHDFLRATTPLLHNDLRPVPRPYEGRLPDAMKNPRQIRVDRLPQVFTNLVEPFPRPPEFYFPAVLEESPWLREQAEYEAER